VTLANSSAPDVRVALAPGGPDEARARIDASQVRQVLWNLVRNAVLASPQGAQVDVRVERAPQGTVLVVADRGRGIAPEQREKVFSVFYSEDARGTGLGLAIVRQIVDAHGAGIEVRARAGGGTEFVVTFAS
jgi:signal transduction histidine kinase